MLSNFTPCDSVIYPAPCGRHSKLSIISQHTDFPFRYHTIMTYYADGRTVPRKASFTGIQVFKGITEIARLKPRCTGLVSTKVKGKESLVVWLQDSLKFLRTNLLSTTAFIASTSTTVVGIRKRGLCNLIFNAVRRQN